MQPELKTSADIATLKEQVALVTSQLERHKQTIARILERQDKMEVLLAELMKLQAQMVSDDLPLSAPAWNPVEIDE